MWLIPYLGLPCIADMQIGSVKLHQQYNLSVVYHEVYLENRECHPQYAYGLEMHHQQVLSKTEEETGISPPLSGWLHSSSRLMFHRLHIKKFCLKLFVQRLNDFLTKRS